MRAIAILAVISWHSALASQFPLEALGPVQALVTSGWAGVDLFFALSGFLITTLLLREEAERGRFSLSRFYLRRALRILPVFYAVFILLTFVLARSSWFASVRVMHVWQKGSALGLWPYATFWGNYFTGYFQGAFSRPVYNPGDAFLVFWSLCVEEHFYLLWPLVLLGVRSARVRVSVALAVCLALAALRFFAWSNQWDPESTIHTASHYRLDSLLIGSLGALMFDSACLRPRALRIVGLTAAGVSAYLVADGSLSVRPAGNALGASLGLSAVAVASTVALMELRRLPLAPWTRALEARPFKYLGRLSYAMYLIHFPMIDLGRRLYFSVPRSATLGNFLVATCWFTLLSVAAAAVLHHAVERPFLQLKRRLGRTRSE